MFDNVKITDTPEHLLEVVEDVLKFFKETKASFKVSLTKEYNKIVLVKDLESLKEQLYILVDGDIPKEERVAKLLKDAVYSLTQSVFESTKMFFDDYISIVLKREIAVLEEATMWFAIENWDSRINDQGRVTNPVINSLQKRKRDVENTIRPILYVAGEGVDFASFTSFIDERVDRWESYLSFIEREKEVVLKELLKVNKKD